MDGMEHWRPRITVSVAKGMGVVERAAREDGHISCRYRVDQAASSVNVRPVDARKIAAMVLNGGME
jgi:hypothetical protein